MLRFLEKLFAGRTIELLEREIALLRSELEHNHARLAILESDERELRLNLLRRSGALLSEAQIDAKDREFKPVKKTVLPWSQAAAKLEADSRERYWKKQIEIREAPQEQRKAWAQSASQEDIDKDLAVLNDVSSS